MSSNPAAVSIYAQITLKPDPRLRQEADNAAKVLHDAFKKVTLPAIKLDVDRAALQAAVDKAISGIKVQPITVPVKLQPMGGGIPGMPGGAGMPGGWGSAGATGAGGGTRSAMAPLPGPALPGTGPGGGAGSEADSNGLNIPGGVGRLIGPMAIAHMAVNAYAARQQYEASLISAGAPADPLNRGQRTALGTALGGPIGAGIGFFGGGDDGAKLPGTGRQTTEDLHAQMQAERAYREHLEGLGYGVIGKVGAGIRNIAEGRNPLDNGSAELARIERDTTERERKTQRLERFAGAGATMRESNAELEKRTGEIGATDETKRRLDLADERRKMEKRAQELEALDTRGGQSPLAKKAREDFTAYEKAVEAEAEKQKMFRRVDTATEGRTASLRLDGKADEAERQELENRQAKEYRGRLMKYGAAEADEYKRAVQDPEREQFDREQRARREDDEKKSADRIIDTRASANERAAKAAGATHTAERSAFFRSEDDKVKKAQEAADRIVGNDPLKKRLQAEADATREASGRNKDSFEMERNRGVTEEARDVGLAAEASSMRRGGHFRAAEQRESDDKLREEQRRIRQKYATYGPLSKVQQDSLDTELRASAGRAGIRQDEMDYRKEQENRGQSIDTAESLAYAKGQGGVGQVLGMADQFRAMEANAETQDDKDRVRKLEEAKVAAMKKQYAPQGGVHAIGFSGDESFQGGINHGYQYTEANKLLDELGKNGAGGTEGVDKLIGEAQSDLAPASKDLRVAAGIIRNAKAIAVLR